MIDPLKLSQTLNSRLCHEISNPISGVATCYDLIDSEDKAIKDGARKLLKLSTEKLKCRINFYRYLYGYLGKPILVDKKEIEALSNQLLFDGKVKLQFLRDENLQIESDFAKIIMCLVVLGEMNAIRGGVITISIESAGKYYSARINVSGKSLRFEDNKRRILTEDQGMDDAALETSTVHEYYTRYLCEASKYKISITHSEEEIEYYLQHI